MICIIKCYWILVRGVHDLYNMFVSITYWILVWGVHDLYNIYNLLDPGLGCTLFV